jgi:hypothetical protein
MGSYPVAAVRGKNTLVAGATTLILDQFTDTNGTALSSHTIAPTNTPATSWTNGLNSLEIQSNKAVGVTSSDDNIELCDSGQSDVTASVIVNSTVVAGGGPVVRASDGSNMWLAYLASVFNSIRLFEINAASFVERATASQTVTSGVDYTQRLAASGTSLVASVDGGASCNYSSSFNQSATKVGIHAYNLAGTSPTLDTFTVTRP